MSAGQGFAEAEVEVGNGYYWGSGIEKSHSLAIKYYQMGAEQGSYRAQNNLGYMYEKGKGIPKDEIKVFYFTLLFFGFNLLTFIWHRSFYKTN